MSTPSEIVARFGGPEVVAARFNLSLKAVEVWDSRGAIPGKWHLPLMFWAGEIGVTLDPQELHLPTAEPLEARA